jgi:hypothetical protein
MAAPRRRSIPPELAELARAMRVRRRTRSGLRETPWRQIADELHRRGHGRIDPTALAEACAALPLETHPLAPPTPAAIEGVEASFRAGWAADFPDEPWPGLEEARRRLRLTGK